MNTTELIKLRSSLKELIIKKIKNKIFYHITICNDMDIYITKDMTVKIITPTDNIIQNLNQLDPNFLVLLRVALTDRRHLRRIYLLPQEQSLKLFAK